MNVSDRFVARLKSARFLLWVAGLPLTATMPAASAAEVTANPFGNYCLVCHGVDGRGVEGLGVSLVGSKFVAGKTSAELVEFIKAGRLPNDPASISGRPMPGFAWIADEELEAIVAQVKALAGS